MVEITTKGKQILKIGKFTVQDWRKDADYIEHCKKFRKDKGDTPNQVESLVENDSPQDLIDSAFSTIEQQVKTELLEKLKSIDPYYFERVILLLLNKMGYGDFIETPKSNDGGIDGVVNEDKLGLSKIYIQAKRYSENKVSEQEIRNFIGAMSGDTSKGIFVTTSGFYNSAVVKARDAHHKIILIDGYKLVDLMYQYEVGVEVKNTYEFKKVDEDFFEAN